MAYVEDFERSFVDNDYYASRLYEPQYTDVPIEKVSNKIKKYLDKFYEAAVTPEYVAFLDRFIKDEFPNVIYYNIEMISKVFVYIYRMYVTDDSDDRPVVTDKTRAEPINGELMIDLLNSIKNYRKTQSELVLSFCNYYIVTINKMYNYLN